MGRSNEIFIVKTVGEISRGFNLNIEDQKKLMDMLYRCTTNYDVIETVHDKNSFLDLVSIYSHAKRIEGLSDATLRNRFYILRELDNYVQKSYDEITVADLRMYIMHKQEKLNATSINNIIGQIKPFFNWLQDEEYITVNPCKKLKRTKQPVRLIHSMSTIDLEKLRVACDNNRDRALVEFAFATGMRISEIVNANIEDLDMCNNRLLTIGKGDKEREILFSDKTKFYLERYLSSRSDSNNALFVSTRKPYNRIGSRSIQKIIKKIKEKAGIKTKVTPHVLRHTMATKMIEGGADITTVQFLLGHENVTTTQIYAETSIDKVKYQYKQCLNV